MSRRAITAVLLAATILLTAAVLTGAAATTPEETGAATPTTAVAPLPREPEPGSAQDEQSETDEEREPFELDRTSCTICHGDDELFEGELLQIVEDYAVDVHAEVGLSCHDCHGGDPDPALFEDFVGAKDEELDDNPYRGVPETADVPEFCGSCHSDASYMRRFDPNPRVDQVREYGTSQHGRLLAEGDENVATCISCHGVHGIRRPTNLASRVHPTRVGETCSNCHADAGLMSDYTLDNGRPLPIDQYAKWSESVHAAAMFDREDLSAPTCNDCHGNHGAVPPGLSDISFVCGQCHGREAEIFRTSPKQAGFLEHNEYLLDAGDEGCAACHIEPEPQVDVTLHSFGECASCHGNHGVVRPTLAFLSPLPDTPCAFCHEGETPVVGGPGDLPRVVESYTATRDRLLQQAAERGLEGTQRFDWLVDRVTTLASHTLPAPEDADVQPLRPAFARLYEKFRIGKTTYEYEDPVTGEIVEAPILRCASCHAGEEVLGDDAVGLQVAETLLQKMRELTIRTAQAERTLLAARRGGVETGEVGLEVDRAVDAQIQLEVLLHAFSTEEGGQFMSAHAEGIAHADAALAGGLAALEELTFRRQGLAVALVIIILVLVALGLKIRQLSAREAATAGVGPEPEPDPTGPGVGPSDGATG